MKSLCGLLSSKTLSASNCASTSACPSSSMTRFCSPARRSVPKGNGRFYNMLLNGKTFVLVMNCILCMHYGACSHTCIFLM